MELINVGWDLTPVDGILTILHLLSLSTQHHLTQSHLSEFGILTRHIIRGSISISHAQEVRILRIEVMVTGDEVTNLHSSRLLDVILMIVLLLLSSIFHHHGEREEATSDGK